MKYETHVSRGSAAAVTVTLLLLAAVLVPRWLEADVISDLAQQRANLNVVSLALGEYYIDEDQLPPWFISYDPPGGVANAALPGNYLTTPVDYLNSQQAVLTPIFSATKYLPWYRLQGLPGFSCFSGDRWTSSGCSISNFSSRTSVFLNCPDFQPLVTSISAYVIWAPGPTRRVLGSGVCTGHPYEDVPYDPSNGTISNGHIFHFAGLPATADAEWRHYR